MEDLVGIGKLADSKLAQRAYEDLGSAPAKQIGHIASDWLKAFRLLTLPLQLLATAHDRFDRWLSKVRDAVPPERQVEAAPEIAGPVLLNLRFFDDENELRHLYLNLLTLAIDSQNRHRAHPGFIRVIEQLSPQDAEFLQHLSKRTPIDGQISLEAAMPVAVIARKSCPGLASWALDDLQSALDLLRGLSVVTFDSPGVANFEGQPYRAVEIQLTQFGKNFVAACLPKNTNG